MSLLTSPGFPSLFPLVLVLSMVLGFVLDGDPHLQQQLLNSALTRFPVIGVPCAGSLYGALGVGRALQNAMNTAWAVPRNHRPDPVLGRTRSLLILATAGLAVLATTVVSGVASTAHAADADLGHLVRVALLVVSVAVNAGVFVFALGSGPPGG